MGWIFEGFSSQLLPAWLRKDEVLEHLVGTLKVRILRLWGMKYPAKRGASYLPNDGAKEQMVNECKWCLCWQHMAIWIAYCNMFHVFFCSVAMQFMRVQNRCTTTMGLAGTWTPKRSQKVDDRLVWRGLFTLYVFECVMGGLKNRVVNSYCLWIMMWNKWHTIVLVRGVKLQIAPAAPRWLEWLSITLSQLSWHQAPWISLQWGAKDPNKNPQQ